MRDKCRLIRLRNTPATRQTKEIEMRALIAKIVHGAVDNFTVGLGDDELALKSKAAVYRAVAQACLDEAKQIDLLTAPNETCQAKN